MVSTRSQYDKYYLNSERMQVDSLSKSMVFRLLNRV